MRKIFLLSISCFCLAQFAFSSSALFIKRDARVLGKNFDAVNGEGMLLKNNRGVKKVAYNFDQQKMAEWTSKFGSITFHQIGKEFPIGGINEMGLAVEMLSLPNTQYEESEGPTLSEFEWVQYVLDNFVTAADVSLAIDSIFINPLYCSAHYLIADRAGRSFVVEFVNGKTKIYSTASEEYVALTNSFYTTSVDYYKNQKDNIDWESKSSLNRYAQLIKKGEDRSNKFVGAMFNVMEASSQNKGSFKTQWTIVYDLDSRSISYKTAQEGSIKTILLGHFNFKPQTQLYYRDINSESLDWKVINSKSNGSYLTNFLKSFTINHEALNQHMMNPSLPSKDDLYPMYYKDIQLTFWLKKQEGYVFYKLFEGGDNFKNFISSREGVIAANQDTISATLYSVKVSDYAVSSFHDFNNNNKRDKKLLGFCKEPIAYSKSKSSKASGVDYEDVKFHLKEENRLFIPIK